MSSRLVVHPKAQPAPTPPKKNKSNTKQRKTNCSSKRRFETLLHEASWIYTESSRINTLISHPTFNLLSSLIIASCLWSPWCAQKKVHPNSLPPRIYQVPPATVGETTGKKSSPMARSRDVRRRLRLSFYEAGVFLEGNEECSKNLIPTIFDAAFHPFQCSMQVFSWGSALQELEVKETKWIQYTQLK